jgi:hypothetical protein
LSLCLAGAASQRFAGFAFLAIVAMAMDDQELLTASQAAEALSASSQTIRRPSIQRGIFALLCEF